MTGDPKTDLKASVILGALEAAELYLLTRPEHFDRGIYDCTCGWCAARRRIREAIALVKRL